MTDLLCNAERAALNRPRPSNDNEAAALAGHWHGSATSRVEHWRRRALAAERELAELRGDLGLCSAWDR
jgi:hypothetical protein